MTAPVTTPEDMSTVAFPLELDQVPPAKPLLDKLVVLPTATDNVPEIVPALGSAFIVTVAVAVLLQPKVVTV